MQHAGGEGVAGADAVDDALQLVAARRDGAVARMKGGRQVVPVDAVLGADGGGKLPQVREGGERGRHRVGTAAVH